MQVNLDPNSGADDSRVRADMIRKGSRRKTIWDNQIETDRRDAIRRELHFRYFVFFRDLFLLGGYIWLLWWLFKDL